MKIGLYPGSFDPVTFGHLDVIERSRKMVDKLIVGVLQNRQKTPLFSMEERVRMIAEHTKEWDNVEVHSFTGLTVKEIASFHGDISAFVPKDVEEAMKKKFDEQERRRGI